MKHYIIFVTIIIFNLLVFLLGNVVYSNLVDINLIYKILISELCFIVLYSVTDYANARFGVVFAFCYIPLLAIGFLNVFSELFYSNNVQVLSISVAIVSSLINFSVFRILYNKMKTVLFSSRISTSLTSVVEAGVFSYFLEIGLNGFLLTLTIRFFYVFIVSKLLFESKTGKLKLNTGKLK